MNQQNVAVSEMCEALGCSENATKQISIPVGEKGSIVLSVCQNCVKKFMNNGEIAQVR